MAQKNVLANSTKCAACVKNAFLQYNNNNIFVLPGKFEGGENL